MLTMQAAQRLFFLAHMRQPISSKFKNSNSNFNFGANELTALVHVHGVCTPDVAKTAAVEDGYHHHVAM